MQETDLTKFRQIFDKLPKWLRIVIICVVCALLALVGVSTLSGCSTIRIMGNNGKVNTSVSQSALDSTKITITYEPR